MYVLPMIQQLHVPEHKQLLREAVKVRGVHLIGLQREGDERERRGGSREVRGAIPRTDCCLC
jgi:hypothetical protein